jgi:hypothetical protein
MLPCLRPGTVVVGLRVPIKVNKIVIAVVQNREVIKRVTQITGSGYWLEGDNKRASTDSRNYGFVPKSAIKAVVVWPIKL